MDIDKIINLLPQHVVGGQYLYKLEVDGEIYYHFERWTATAEMIQNVFYNIGREGGW